MSNESEIVILDDKGFDSCKKLVHEKKPVAIAGPKPETPIVVEVEAGDLSRLKRGQMKRITRDNRR